MAFCPRFVPHRGALSPQRESMLWTYLHCSKILFLTSIALISLLVSGLALRTNWLGVAVPNSLLKGSRTRGTTQPINLAPSPKLLNPPTAAQRDTLSIYVENISSIYVTGATRQDNSKTDKQYGYTALGTLISADDDHWDSVWHNIDAWFINQIRTSVLRTYDGASADIIFVPAMFAINNREQQESFVNDAPEFLPYFGKKLHLVALNHAPSAYNRNSNMLIHANCHKFTFLSFGLIEKRGDPDQNAFLLGAPQFSHVHWSRGSRQLCPSGRHFDAARTAQSKKYLAAESFNVRHYPDRSAVFDDCHEVPNKCLHVNYTGAQDAVRVFKAYKSAWYVLHPRADFVSRSAWFDTLLADSIPVVFQDTYINSVPFAEFFNYTKIMTYVPEENVTREEGQNIVQLLANTFNEQEALERIGYIHSVRQVFQYMQNPAHEVVRWSERAVMHAEDDAFTFTLKSVLRDACTRGWLADRCTVSPLLNAGERRVSYHRGTGRRKDHRQGP